MKPVRRAASLADRPSPPVRGRGLKLVDRVDASGAFTGRPLCGDVDRNTLDPETKDKLLGRPLCGGVD